MALRALVRAGSPQKGFGRCGRVPVSEEDFLPPARLLRPCGHLAGTPFDPLVFVGATLLLLGFKAATAIGPSRRASMLGPTSALRLE